MQNSRNSALYWFPFAASLNHKSGMFFQRILFGYRVCNFCVFLPQLAMSKAIIAYEHLQTVKQLNNNVSSLQVLTFAEGHPLGECKFLRVEYGMVLIVVLSHYKRSFWEKNYNEEPVMIVGISSVAELQRKIISPVATAEERSGFAIGDDPWIKVRITL